VSWKALKFFIGPFNAELHPLAVTSSCRPFSWGHPDQSAKWNPSISSLTRPNIWRWEVGLVLCVLSQRQKQAYMVVHFTSSLSHSPNSINNEKLHSTEQTLCKKCSNSTQLWAALLHFQHLTTCNYNGTRQFSWCPLSSTSLFMSHNMPPLYVYTEGLSWAWWWHL
jgi:hypothetical protein